MVVDDYFAEGVAVLADDFGESAGVDAGDGGDVVVFEPLSEALDALVVAVVVGVFADDEAFDGGFVAFEVFGDAVLVGFVGGDAVVADEG